MSCDTYRFIHNVLQIVIKYYGYLLPFQDIVIFMNLKWIVVLTFEFLKTIEKFLREWLVGFLTLRILRFLPTIEYYSYINEIKNELKWAC